MRSPEPRLASCRPPPPGSWAASPGLAVLVLVAAARGAAHLISRRDGPPAARAHLAVGVQLVLLEVGLAVGLVPYGLFEPAAFLFMGVPQVIVFRRAGRAFCHRGRSSLGISAGARHHRWAGTRLTVRVPRCARA